MKIRKTSTLGSDSVSDEAKQDRSQLGSRTATGWASTDPTRFAEIAQEAKKANLKAPEIWFLDGEPRRLRFRTKDPLAQFERYSVAVGNGRYDKFVRPAPGEIDLLAQELRLKPSLVFLWEVLDLDGYTSTKTGKTHRRIPRFFAATGKQYEQLMQLSQMVGMPLHKFVVIVARSGKGKDTTYTFLPEQPLASMSEKELLVESIAKDWTKYYSPVSDMKQRQLCAGFDPREED